MTKAKTKKFLTEDFVRNSTVEKLSRMGYGRRLRTKGKGEHGIDIKVRHNRYPRYYIVEIKGGANPKTVKHPGSRREVSFLNVLGQILTRMGYKAKYKYGIGLPDTYSEKVFKRLPWQICKKIRLTVFLVNENGKVKVINWKDLKSKQS